MTLRLLPGIGLARRDADHLQLGVDPPRRVVLPDVPEVRLLVDALAHGRDPGRLSGQARWARSRIEAAGLARPADADLVRRRALARLPVAVRASPETAAVLSPLLAGAGVVQPTTVEPVAVLVVAETEVARSALDPLVRDGVPHLVVSTSVAGPTVGPFVAPGTTACLRCIDAHLAEGDPRRSLVVEQVASQPPLVAAAPDPALRSIALGWAVRDLVTFLEGRRPVTWSATVRVGTDLVLAPRQWLRHPHCGCCWGERLAAAAG